MNQFIYFFLIIPFFTGCAQHAGVGDRKINKKNAPAFLIEAGENLKNPEYFKKTFDNGSIHYEVKDDENEISLIFDKEGRFLEREEDILFKDLHESLQLSITNYLLENYPNYKLLEVEKRKSPEGSYIDVEIRHKSSPSGYWELSFGEDGKFFSKEIEIHDYPTTLN